MKRIELSEAQLKQMVQEILKESMGNYKEINDLSDYIKTNNISMRQASKFARINAVPAKGGERINTIASDGTNETTNVAKQGDYIVNNVGNPNNKWIIDPVTFAKKYQPDPTQEGVFMPKGGPMNAGQISEPISFMAPWGERMNIDKGGYLLQTPDSENDIYGISKTDSDSTYRFNDDMINESNKVTLNEKFKSPKLAQIAKENGGLETQYLNGYRDGNSAYKYGRTVPASEITDDMIGDTFNETDPEYYKKLNNSVGFNNGTRIQLKNIDKLPYNSHEAYWEKTDKNYGRDGIEDRTDYPGGRINDYSSVPSYTKVNGDYYQNVLMTGSGDTGRHDKKVEPQQDYKSPTSKSADARHLRQAIDYNKQVGDKQALRNLRNYAKELLGKQVFEETVKTALKEVLQDIPMNDLEDTPEYRPEGNKYFKYSVHGHTFEQPRPKYDEKENRYFVQDPIIDYPSEEFDNIEDARACADRYRKMPHSIPDNVRIKGHYHTLGDDDWEYTV